MKYIVLVCEGMADDPMEEFGRRTPLELAKAPAIQELSKRGRVGSATFTSHKLPLSADVAAMAILGYNPEEFYTGLAPLEALAAGIAQNDNQIVFRCDLVTVSEETLVDVSASFISPTESQRLIEELNRKLSDPRVKFFPREGSRNLLMIQDPEKAEGLDELECVPPTQVIGQKFAKFLPKGDGAPMITELMDKSKAILEDQEINRVRIDLKENPANMIWPWGQGRKPKLPRFAERHKLKNAACFSSVEFVQGLAAACGMESASGLDAVATKQFAFVYQSADVLREEADPMKRKIRLIEHFDAHVVTPVLKAIESEGDARILVCTDVASSFEKKSPYHGSVPFLMAGAGIQPEENTGFNEKSASQGKINFNEGYKLLENFLK